MSIKRKTNITHPRVFNIASVPSELICSFPLSNSLLSHFMFYVSNESVDITFTAIISTCKTMIQYCSKAGITPMT